MICNEVVLADVANAGAIDTPSVDDVVVDRDLVTGRTWHEMVAFIEAIAEQICSGVAASSPVADQGSDLLRPRTETPSLDRGRISPGGVPACSRTYGPISSQVRIMARNAVEFVYLTG